MFQEDAPQPDTDTSGRQMSLRDRILRLAPSAAVFALTALALGLHVERTSVSLGGDLARVVAWVWPSVFFGLALSLVLRRWSERLVVAIATAPVYWAAVALFAVMLRPLGVLGYVPSGVLGAVGMCSLLAMWESSYWRAIPLAAGMGAIGGILFPWVAFVTTSPAGSHLIWQVLVGCALVDYGLRRGTIAQSFPSAVVREATATAVLASLAISWGISQRPASEIGPSPTGPAAVQAPALDTAIGEPSQSESDPTGAGQDKRSPVSVSGNVQALDTSQTPVAQTSKQGQSASVQDEGIIRFGVSLVIARQLGYELWEINPSSTLKQDLGADSLDLLDVALALEEEFEIEISGDEERRLTCEAGVARTLCLSTVDDVRRFVSGKVAAKNR